METQIERQPWEDGGRLETMWPLGSTYQGVWEATNEEANFSEELYGHPDLPTIGGCTFQGDIPSR